MRSSGKSGHMYGVYSQLSRRDVASRSKSRLAVIITRQIRIFAILIIFAILFLLNFYHSPRSVQRSLSAPIDSGASESLPRLRLDVQPSEEDSIIGRPENMHIQELDIPLLVSEGTLSGLIDPSSQDSDPNEEDQDTPYLDAFEGDDYDIIETEPDSEESLSSPQRVSSYSSPVDWSRFAYMQYVTDKYYLCNSVMIFEALHRLGSKPERVMLYPKWMLRDPATNESRDELSRLLIKARDEYDVTLMPIQVLHQDKNDGMHTSLSSRF
jgi:hypothetical protein